MGRSQYTMDVVNPFTTRPGRVDDRLSYAIGPACTQVSGAADLVLARSRRHGTGTVQRRLNRAMSDTLACRFAEQALVAVFAAASLSFVALMFAAVPGLSLVRLVEHQ